MDDEHEHAISAADDLINAADLHPSRLAAGAAQANFILLSAILREVAALRADLTKAAE